MRLGMAAAGVVAACPDPLPEDGVAGAVEDVGASSTVRRSRFLLDSMLSDTELGSMGAPRRWTDRRCGMLESTLAARRGGHLGSTNVNPSHADLDPQACRRCVSLHRKRKTETRDTTLDSMRNEQEAGGYAKRQKKGRETCNKNAESIHIQNQAPMQLR